MRASEALQAGRILFESFGWTGIRLRAGFELRRVFSLYRNAPSAWTLAQSPAPSAWPFAVSLDAIAELTDRDVALRRAERVVGGNHHAYHSAWQQLPATPDAWNVHPLTGVAYPRLPWSRVQNVAASMNPAFGDVKDVWEPARFTWVFDLIRGYAVTRDERFAEAFWRILESFLIGAPAFIGVQWTCGQETSIRALSCLWAEAAFERASPSTPDRRARLQMLLLASAERVADAIEYGVSQRNNHGISEATALIALGARFARSSSIPAAEWSATGRRWLDHCVVDQFATDGWYTQHSFNYLRVAIDQLLVAQRVLAATGAPTLSHDAVERARAGVRLLASVVDGKTGDVPNHGANDGALVLPIATTAYRDYRPTISAAASVFDVVIPDDIVPNWEALAWVGATSPPATEARGDVATGPSGWIDARIGSTRVFARAGTYRSRPSHIDPVHTDVWLNGRPAAVDAGSYRYTALPPWKNALNAINVHNTVSIPSMEAARKGPRFLWLSRPSARVERWRVVSDRIEIDLANDTWKDRGVEHRRRIELGGAQVRVVDRIESSVGNLEIVVHWLVPDGAATPRVESAYPMRVETIMEESDGVLGWCSLEYARKLPATSVRIFATTLGSSTSVAEIVTVFEA